TLRGGSQNARPGAGAGCGGIESRNDESSAARVLALDRALGGGGVAHLELVCRRGPEVDAEPLVHVVPVKARVTADVHRGGEEANLGRGARVGAGADGTLRSGCTRCTRAAHGADR